MKRREFLTSVAAGAALPGVKVAKGSDDDKWWDLEYAGFRLKWTGWKRAMSNPYHASQWIANREPDDVWLYVSHIGSSNSFVMGEVFDISHQKNQIPITDKSTEAEKEVAKLRLLSRMKHMIDFWNEHVCTAQSWREHHYKEWSEIDPDRRVTS